MSFQTTPSINPTLNTQTWGTQHNVVFQNARNYDLETLNYFFKRSEISYRSYMKAFNKEDVRGNPCLSTTRIPRGRQVNTKWFA
jgi:hypothetical protein